eukprot:CAMPEP_0167815942 /NCGR_PEP_ID=MMETSP0112_2-20121227/3309_1 /TAXON_ID=91324 /ORGANISM="Lotharella globosa, Strain CCCM811" /LENGTH=168 /DNA_ID=CAMNT_0007715431 /DNA_START=105 /DNA_END=611 /DNA_ORIENTATION=+
MYNLERKHFFVPSEKLARVLQLHSVDDVQELVSSSIDREQLLRLHVLLVVLGEIGVDGARMQRYRADGVPLQLKGDASRGLVQRRFRHAIGVPPPHLVIRDRSDPCTDVRDHTPALPAFSRAFDEFLHGLNHEQRADSIYLVRVHHPVSLELRQLSLWAVDLVLKDPC